MSPNEDRKQWLEFARFVTSRTHEEYRDLLRKRSAIQNELTTVELHIQNIGQMGELSPVDRKRLGSWQIERTKILGKLAQSESALKERDRAEKGRLETSALQYDAILALPRAFSLSVVTGNLVLETQTLYGKNAPGDWRVIGEFDLTYSPSGVHTSAQLSWKNKRGCVLVKSPYNNSDMSVMTPTGVGYDGRRMCLGNAENVLETAIRASDFVTLFAVMMRFAECPGENFGRLITYWPKVPLEEVPPWYRQQFGN